MTKLPDGPLLRSDLSHLAVCAAQSVPLHLSARRRGITLLALAVVPLLLGLPLLGSGPATAIAGLISLAVGLRFLALLDGLTRGMPASHPRPAVLPRISILVPLRGEARVVAGLTRSLRRLDYPSGLIEVIALLEADDLDTCAAVAKASHGWQVVALPPGRPQNKPRACNVGLALATGDIVVVFDAEDRPEAEQALKAVAALGSDTSLAVVQARLGCDHAEGGNSRLARFWGLEYAVLFGAIQPILARHGLPFLLGGTSNWFRADALRAVGGWDAHNVTEDADLGVRLARAGWRSTVIDSTTWEEAPIGLGQWLRQRSRWLKGFIVTTAVHFANPVRLTRDLGLPGMLAVTAQLPASVLCIAAHPVGLWLLGTGRLEGHFGALAIIGYLISTALHMVVARRQRTSLWIALLMPLYWLLLTPALVLALVDLARDPTHWRKTDHGLADRPEDARAPRPGGIAARRRRLIPRVPRRLPARSTQPAARTGPT